MRKQLTVVVLAVLALALIGAKTKDSWPACGATDRGVELYENFVKAIYREDNFAVQFYMSQGLCGPMMKGMEVLEVLERGDHWIKIRIQPPGDNAPVVVYTSKDAITE